MNIVDRYYARVSERTKAVASGAVLVLVFLLLGVVW